jgi:acetyl-CoA synthetase
MLEFDPHVLDEKSVPPPEEFSSRAHVRSLDEYRKMYEAAEKDPEAFWGERTKLLDWFTPPTKILEWDPPHAKWFSDGKLNVSHNCLDRHLPYNRNKPALIWEAEDGPTLQFTFAELHERVCRMANALLHLGVKPRDCVAIYMPMVPELPIAMLACARIGAVHSVIFGGFSATALIDRIADAKAKILITADGGYRRGKLIPLKETADVALKNCPTIEKSIVLKRSGHEVDWQEGRDLWWHDLEKAASKDCPASHLDAEHPLYILYTSGTTGKPKGVLHTTAGYLLQTTWTTRLVFDLKDEDVYWCTADIGWVTGHSYIVYGPLSNGATIVMYEARPTNQPKTASGRSSSETKSRFSTAPRPPSAPSCPGEWSGSTNTTSAASVSSEPSASRSTPRRGNGILKPSEKIAAPSLTPGGRPKPAP